MSPFDTLTPTPARATLVRRLRGCLPDVAAFAGALLVAVLGALLLGSLPGCGGGVGGEGTGSFASGTISGYGSIIVNGVHFDERNAQRVDDEGNPLRSEDLALGMVVQVSGGAIRSAADGSPSAVAQSVRTQRALVGPAGTPDLAAGRLRVLGQTVAVSADTVFDDRLAGGLAGIVAGQRLEVYGFYDASRAVYAATRIAPAAVAGTRLSGPLSSVDSGAGSVTLGGQTYRLAAGSTLGGLAAGTVARLDLQPAGDDPDRWEVRAGAGSSEGAPADREGAGLEGLVGTVLSSTRFVVNGVTVDTSAARIDGTVQPGAQVEVSGALRAGVLLASKVEARSAGTRLFELKGPIASLDRAGQRFVLRGTTVSYARADLRFDAPASAAGLAVGRALKVEGVLSADRTVLEATRIRFDD